MANFDRINPHKLHSARRAFANAGVSVAAWADANGFSRTLTYQVLHGRIAGKRGEGFRIAVALGLRRATPMSMEEFSRKLLKTNLEEEKMT
jgi:gp16 family phage-associated protein